MKLNVRSALAALAVSLGLGAQETPHPNRLAWLSILPEPLPEGTTQFALEGSNQFLRPDRRDTADGRTHAYLQGEDWSLVSDLACALGPGRFNLRTRVTYRSSGIASRAIMNWHDLLGVEQGGRDQAPTFDDVYHLDRDGVTVFDLRKPRLQIQGVDAAWVLPFGTGANGGRAGASLQIPTGHLDTLQSSGGLGFLAGLAGWRTLGPIRVWAQAEQAWMDLPEHSPLKAVISRRHVFRAYAGASFEGPGGSLLRGLGLDLSWAYAETPYRTGLVRIDKYGLQQTWVFRHRNLPRWRFGFTEKGGTFTNPEITGFVVFRP
ncbi:DUF3187 family protein [Mesoterricola sediminis]|uniref:DUF3187 family protein n=1 Tax=Mesoterricola sediminis TaxID=2927980 RepID=A0AA48KDR4_9BACT|nr:DUF3187 family protein [Mesoterricola sediminis]BDU78619.1 hypothetical protein METESE_35770 [Mesoterricola sediminis]